MLIKVELHPDVDWFVRRRCTRVEQEEFYKALDLIRSAPIGHSEPVYDPELSRYMLRFFRFRNCLAVFEYDAGRNLVRIIQCRRVPPDQRTENTG